MLKRKKVSDVNTDQFAAINKLKKVKVGALFMEPGTGKTRVAVELINSTDTDLAIFIVPYRTKDNISKELDKWYLKTKRMVVGVESLSNSDKLYIDLLLAVKKYKHVYMIVDESLKIKNINAKRTKRVLNIGKFAEYKLILNGTPISKNLLDLYPQMLFLSPKILAMDLQQFESTFIKRVVYQEHGHATNVNKHNNYISGYTNIDYLASLINPFVFEAKLSLDVLKNHVNIGYTIKKFISDYDYYKYELIHNIGLGGSNAFLEYTQLMQQSYCIEPQKLAILKRIIKEKEVNNVIVFCKFIMSKNFIQKNCNVKVLTYGKGALGLNLQKYNTIVFWDKTFDYALQEQAERRIYRLGQKDDCTFYHLNGNVGLEKMINKNISNKVSMLDSFKKATAEGKQEDILNAL